MSHFAVFVIGEDVEGQLAPYQEYDDPTGYETELDITERVRKTAAERGMTPAECASDYYDLPLLETGGEPDFGGRHRSGYHTLDENGELDRAISYDNHNSRWDWYSIGGRWSGFLLLKNGERADSAALSEIDFDGMKQAAAEKAARKWDMIREAVGNIPFRRWEEIRDSGADIETARQTYHSQPAIAAIREKLENDFLFDDPLEIISRDREEYIEETALSSVLPFAVLKDGEWREEGRMGWWAMVSDRKPKGEWLREAWEMIRSSAPDTEITVVDCHV